MLRIKKNDQVVVIAGRDKGKTGRVIKVLLQKQRALVEHVNIVKKAQRKTKDNPQGGLVEIEMPIHLSNIMLIDKKSNKHTRLGASILKDGSKVRIGKRSGEQIS